MTRHSGVHQSAKSPVTSQCVLLRKNSPSVKCVGAFTHYAERAIHFWNAEYIANSLRYQHALQTMWSYAFQGCFGVKMAHRGFITTTLSVFYWGGIGWKNLVDSKKNRNRILRRIDLHSPSYENAIVIDFPRYWRVKWMLLSVLATWQIRESHDRKKQTICIYWWRVGMGIFELFLSNPNLEPFFAGFERFECQWFESPIPTWQMW